MPSKMYGSFFVWRYEHVKYADSRLNIVFFDVMRRIIERCNNVNPALFLFWTMRLPPIVPPVGRNVYSVRWRRRKSWKAWCIPQVIVHSFRPVHRRCDTLSLSSPSKANERSAWSMTCNARLIISRTSSGLVAWSRTRPTDRKEPSSMGRVRSLVELVMRIVWKKLGIRDCKLELLQLVFELE